MALHEDPEVTVLLERGFEVIADLHLDPADVASCSEFSSWLDGRQGLERLVILGDLFDAWGGPAHSRMDGAGLVIDALRRVHERGGSVDLLWGNRDFLLDDHVARLAGARLRRDSMVAVNGAGERTLFIHGDELCTMDISYQRLRRFLRSRIVNKALLGLPLFFTLWLARRLRKKSKRAVGMKPAEEMAMQSAVVLELAKGSQATSLVCGHAHCWRDEQVAEEVRWVVLDAFGGERDCLKVSSDGRLVGASSGFRGTVKDDRRD